MFLINLLPTTELGEINKLKIKDYEMKQRLEETSILQRKLKKVFRCVNFF